MCQYVPKGTDLRIVTNELMGKYQQLVNLRPEKTLGFIQREIVFKEQLQHTMIECCNYQCNIGLRVRNFLE